jgi:hypothetical protein
MFIDSRPRPLFGAPSERDVLVVEYVEQCVSLRWSEGSNRPWESINVSVPPGLSD